MSKPVPHIHAALIKQWADGAIIQCLYSDGSWKDTENPFWGAKSEYRVKPKEKVKVYKWAVEKSSEKDGVYITGNYYATEQEAREAIIHWMPLWMQRLDHTMREMEY